MFKTGEVGFYRIQLLACQVFRVFHTNGQAIDGRPEVIPAVRAQVRPVVSIQREQNALLLVDIHAVLSHLHLLCHLIEASVFAVDEEFGKAYRCGEGQSHVVGCQGAVGVHHFGHVAPVGQQHPVLVLGYAEEFVACVEFDAVGLFLVPLPRAVAAPADTSRNAELRVLTARVHGHKTRYVILLGSDFGAVLGGHMDSKHLVFVAPPVGERVLHSDTVQPHSPVRCGITGAEIGHLDRALILGADNHGLVVIAYGHARNVPGRNRERPGVAALTHMHLHPVGLRQD